MKKILLPEGKNQYKANLHCHSTVSDGRWTVEKLKEEYKKQGYSAIAFTDHEVLVPHNDLTDKDFVALNGIEYTVNDAKVPGLFARKTCHMCMIALDKSMDTMLFYHDEKYLFSNAKNYRSQIKYDETTHNFERQYNPETISYMMQTGRDNNFFVSYNHPVWSYEDPADFLRYKGMTALEIANNGCIVEDYLDYVPTFYDYFLRRGNKDLKIVASDDNHNVHPVDGPRCDSFGCFTMLWADELSYEALADALKNGNYYASQGPSFKGIEYDTETKELTIKTSPVNRVALIREYRKRQFEIREDAPLTETKFTVDPAAGYIRITIYDENGKPADFPAFYVE